MDNLTSLTPKIKTELCDGFQCLEKMAEFFPMLGPDQSERGSANAEQRPPGAAKTILHIDMDAFFAAVEVQDHPELRGLPVVIGSPPDKRGVVSTCSYEARKFGIHSAMPSRTAFQHCPKAIFLPPNMKRYHEVSKQIMEIFRQFTPQVEPLSCDEAFLDVTGARYLFGDGPAIAKKIKAAVKEKTGLSCSVGVAPNMFLAKIASDLNKPDGLTAFVKNSDAPACGAAQNSNA